MKKMDEQRPDQGTGWPDGRTHGEYNRQKTRIWGANLKQLQLYDGDRGRHKWRIPKPERHRVFQPVGGTSAVASSRLRYSTLEIKDCKPNQPQNYAYPPGPYHEANWTEMVWGGEGEDNRIHPTHAHTCTHIKHANSRTYTRCMHTQSIY